jgi:hypothetical protein
VSASYYSPRINRLLVCALYHEAKSRQQPMTHLVDHLLFQALKDSHGLMIAKKMNGSNIADSANELPTPTLGQGYSTGA